VADEVAIPVSLLEEMLETATTAQYHNQTIDLAESYRKQQGTPKWSKLTTKLTYQVELLQSFIEIANTEEEPDESGGETE
jgi:hypothetical protein